MTCWKFKTSCVKYVKASVIYIFTCFIRRMVIWVKERFKAKMHLWTILAIPVYLFPSATSRTSLSTGHNASHYRGMTSSRSHVVHTGHNASHYRGMTTRGRMLFVAHPVGHNHSWS